MPRYAVENLSRSFSARVESQPVIGRRPTTHLLGPDEETIALTSTFHPYHLNGGGLAQLAGVRAAVAAQTPLMLVHVGGRVFGRYVGRDINDEQTAFHARSGVPQTVSVDLTLVKYIG